MTSFLIGAPKKNHFKKVSQNTFSKKDISISLPFLGQLSLSARSKLETTMRAILPCFNLKVVFRIKNRFKFYISLQRQNIKRNVFLTLLQVSV